jgi:hypothetical protein
MVLEFIDSFFYYLIFFIIAKVLYFGIYLKLITNYFQDVL